MLFHKYARLRRLGVDYKEWCVRPEVSGGKPTSATLVDLAAPKFGGHYAEFIGEHPVATRRCPSCGVEGFATLADHPLKLRFHKKPSDGLILIVNDRGGNRLPTPWLTWAISAELRERMAQDSMGAGLDFFDIDISRRGAGGYFGILPTVRFDPMVTPYGPDPDKRHCQECGYTNARFAIYPVFPRPVSLADWFLRSPWDASDICISRPVLDWLTGVAWPLVGKGRSSRMKFRRAGWWPEEKQHAFLPEEYQEGG